MKTPEQIAFSVKIQEIKESGPVSGFALFQAFALWLRDYIAPWVKAHALLLSSAMPSNTHQQMAEAAAKLDSTLQTVGENKEEQMKAYLDFISALIIDPISFTLIKNPIFFFGDNRGLTPRIYNKSLITTSNSEIIFNVRTGGIESTGNYVTLEEHVEPALKCFYTEIGKIKLEGNAVDAVIETWKQEHYDEKTETNRSTPLNVNTQTTLDQEAQDVQDTQDIQNAQDLRNTQDAKDTLMFMLPFAGFVVLGIISSVIFLCVASTSEEAHDKIFALPGDLSFPCWVSFVAGVVFGATNMYDQAWERRGPDHRDGDKQSPYFNIFVAGPAVGTLSGSVIALIVTIVIDGVDAKAALWIGAVVGVGIAMLYEFDRYREFRSLATQRPRTVQAPIGTMTELLLPGQSSNIAPSS